MMECHYVSANQVCMELNLGMSNTRFAPIYPSLTTAHLQDGEH